ncbi:uncharacterized protein LOC119107412, partial [Pollicipes pollicipes]|uniref:uncharacterized protein LOC119107412 n=1 Tax=Pollicipes pollicipes TaxID=41117 RepID=UPI001884AEDD
MTPCPLSAVVALSCAALVIGRFSRQPGIVSGPAVAQLSAPSRLICAACCSTPVEYVSEELTPCPAGWQLFGDSCYLRSSTMPPGYCITGSRPPFGEYIGMRTWDEGTFIDIDGSTPSAKPVLAYNKATGVGCVNSRKEFIMDTFVARPCTDPRDGYICKVPRRCQTRSPCPDGWLGLDAFCYRYFSMRATWDGAALLCRALQPGARLASFPSAGTCDQGASPSSRDVTLLSRSTAPSSAPPSAARLHHRPWRRAAPYHPV